MVTIRLNEYSKLSEDKSYDENNVVDNDRNISDDGITFMWMTRTMMQRKSTFRDIT